MVAMVGKTSGPTRWHFYPSSHLVKFHVDCSQWMLAHGGIPTEDSYGPYLGQDGYCHLDKAEMGLKIKGWVNVTSGDTDALKVNH